MLFEMRIRVFLRHPVKTLTAPQFYLVMDIRNSSTENNDEGEEENDNKAEIIEITVIPINVDECKIMNRQFHSLVRPTINPVLSEKCLNQYKIKQYKIDQADVWTDVLKSLEHWLKEENYTDQNSVIIADQAYEVNLRSQTSVNKWKVPTWMKEYVNIRKDFKEATESKEKLDKLDLCTMLDIAGIQFEGHKMNGHDEAFNTALLVVNMLRRDYKFHNMENIK